MDSKTMEIEQNCEAMLVDQGTVLDDMPYTFSDGVPVAFSYLKFPVDKDGVLLAAEDTTLKLELCLKNNCNKYVSE